MRVKRVLLAAGLAAGVIGGVNVLSATPSNALAVPLGSMSGSVTVSNDMGACATVTAPAGTVITGEFSAVAEGQGPGTQIGTVRWAEPIVAVGTWSNCISGSFVPQFGEGKYTLIVTSVGANDYVNVTQCAWTFGVKNCY